MHVTCLICGVLVRAAEVFVVTASQFKSPILSFSFPLWEHWLWEHFPLKLCIWFSIPQAVFSGTEPVVQKKAEKKIVNIWTFYPKERVKKKKNYVNGSEWVYWIKQDLLLSSSSCAHWCSAKGSSWGSFNQSWIKKLQAHMHVCVSEQLCSLCF